jgi:hypothetical protein
MFGSTILETAIGLALIYALFSTICSAINEWIAATLASRARSLAAGIGQLLGTALRDQLYAHPLIRALLHPERDANDPKALPNYIEPRTFARALLDLLTPAGPPTFAAVAAAAQPPVAAAQPPADAAQPPADAAAAAAALAADQGRVRQALGALLDDIPASARDDAEKLKMVLQNIENWYNGAMERLSGIYKRHTQLAIFWIALAVSAALNVDTLALINRLSNDSTLRAAVVAAAREDARREDLAPGRAPTETPRARIEEIRGELRALDLPLGWPLSGTLSSDWRVYLWKLVGIAITAGALTMGAPFWFDLLNRLINLRAAGQRPSTRQKGDEPS